jgi:hypothetical protein
MWIPAAFGITLFNQRCMPAFNMAENRQNRRMWKRRPARLRFCLPSFPRSLLALLAFVAVLIQSLVVQTHIHHPAINSSQLAMDSASFVPDSASNKSRAPIKADDDSSSCALCQAFTHAGQFLHSAALLARVPVWCNVHLIHFNDPLPIRLAVSHNWQGRAPPLI